MANAVLHSDFRSQFQLNHADGSFMRHEELGRDCLWAARRQVHLDLQRNILALNQTVMPDLVVVDGLIGMSNGPVMTGVSVWSSDRIQQCFFHVWWFKLMDMPGEVPYLVHAEEAGHLLRRPWSPSGCCPHTSRKPRLALGSLSFLRLGHSYG